MAKYLNDIGHVLLPQFKNFLQERRLRMLQTMLPSSGWVTIYTPWWKKLHQLPVTMAAVVKLTSHSNETSSGVHVFLVAHVASAYDLIYVLFLWKHILS